MGLAVTVSPIFSCRKTRKEYVDMIADVFILQGYLDYL